METKHDNSLSSLGEERDEIVAILSEWQGDKPPGMLERLAELNERIEHGKP
jgi:hypothetical protein